MLSMMRAHGLDPGPTQRPLTAGLLAGLAAALPALAILDSFAWLEPLAALLGTTPRGAALLCTAGFTLCGAAYALALGRGANDPLGGWLFGLACGFFLWMLVPLPLLHWLPAWSGTGRPLLVGRPAVGLLLAALAWGSALGALFPPIHRALRAGIDTEPPGAARLGPEAAAIPELSRTLDTTKGPAR